MSKGRTSKSTRGKAQPRRPQPHYRSGPRGTTVRTTPAKGQYRGHPALTKVRKSTSYKIGKALGASTRQIVRKAPSGPRSFPTRTGRVVGRPTRSRKPSRPTRSFPTRSGPRPTKA